MSENNEKKIELDSKEIENGAVSGLDVEESEAWGDYPLDTVFVRKDQRTVRDIVTRIEKGRYIMNPDFQRDFIWSLKQQARLIESCLMRIPLPVLYVAEDLDGKIIVVDGLQRLTTFYNYLNDKFSLKGIGKKNSIISGKKFTELPINLQERIEDTQLTLYILDSKAPERARLDIFERVNSGEALTRQQMRNCLYTGKATRWLMKASKDSSFIKATGGSIKSKTMRDREVINRYCAFYLFDVNEYKGDMDDFLAKALLVMNKMDGSELQEMYDNFIKSMNINYELFERHAFRKSLLESNYAARTVINVSLFEVVSTLIAKNYQFINENNKELYKESIRFALNDYSFNYAISYSTNNTQQVKTRFKILSYLLEENVIC